MKNLVTPAEQGLDSLRRVPAILHRLFICNVITSDAFSLGLQAIAKMQRDGRTQTTLTLREAGAQCVYVDGRLQGGPVFLHDILTGIGALQQIHMQAGIFNGINEASIYAEDVLENHFSDNAFMTFGSDWSLDTPLVFRFDCEDIEYWVDRSARAVEEMESKCVRVDVTIRG